MDPIEGSNLVFVLSPALIPSERSKLVDRNPFTYIYGRYTAQARCETPWARMLCSRPQCGRKDGKTDFEQRLIYGYISLLTYLGVL